MSDVGRIVYPSDYGTGMGKPEPCYISSVNAEHVASWAADREELARLRSRIATLEAQVEQAREALEEDVGECAAWCDVGKGCLACYRFDTCKKRIALQALREGGENG